MTFNVEGLLSIVKNFDLARYVFDIDLVFLTETFTESVPDDMFPNHDVYVAPGIKLSDSVFGRLCGGVACLIKKSLKPFVTNISLDYSNVLAFRIDHALLGTPQDCILVGAYIPPENSPFYKKTEIVNGISVIEEVLLELQCKYENVDFILCGDLNARIGNQNGNSSYDSLSDVFNVTDRNFANNNPAYHVNRRNSKDNCINAFGKYFLNVCDNFGLSVVNGLTDRNFCSDFTYICQSGASVIDLFVVSDSLLSSCLEFKIDHFIESKHSAVLLSIQSSLREFTDTDVDPNDNYSFRKYIWKPEKYQQFNDIISSDVSKGLIDDAISLIDFDINMALSKFNECLKSAGKCMEKSIFVSSKPRNVWFDLECSQSRQVVRHHLRKYVRTSMDDDRIAYATKRREYKQLLRSKKADYKSKFLNDLHENLNDSTKFWASIQSVLYRQNVKPNITLPDWFNHFRSVFRSNHTCKDDQIQIDFDKDIVIEHESDLNQEISEAEIRAGIKALKNKKAAGPDMIINEFYKASVDFCMPFLVKFFNFIFDNGLYPDEWTFSILQPIHKKGDINNPDNYRGISLLNVCSKLYSYILNQRINEWIDDFEILGEEQAGFRKNRSTMEHIFTLYALAQKQLVRHRKLYVAFIDFRKAFDGIARNKLWPILRKNGINGKMFNALKSMYEIVRTKVRMNGEYTDSFFMS